jgi:hypothetical protein
VTGQVPTLYEWVGGAEKLGQLTEEFYGRVLKDPLLEPVLRTMSATTPNTSPPSSARCLADRRRARRPPRDDPAPPQPEAHRTAQQRRRWIELLVDAATLSTCPTIRSCARPSLLTSNGITAGQAEFQPRSGTGTSRRADAELGLGRSGQAAQSAVRKLISSVRSTAPLHIDLRETKSPHSQSAVHRKWLA